MNTQKRLNMNIGNYTKTLRDDLRKSLLITLTLLFVCSGVWGQGTQPAGSGTEGSPYQITSAENLVWVCSHGGYAKLNTSLEGSINFTVSNNKEVTIDLAGLTIKDTYHETYQLTRNNTPIFRVTQGSSLTILDSSPTQEGKITGAYSRRESSLYYDGGGILNYGTVTIKSGKITGNRISYGSGGGIFNATGARLNIEGGEISGNTAEYEGAGICNATGATLNISGGTISGNSGRNGDGIYNAGTMTITGNPTITGNSDQNIYLTTGKKITIGTGGLTCDANSIGITMQSPGTFTTGETSADDYTKFFSDDNHYEAVAVSIDGDAGDNNVKLKSCWSLLDKQIAEATSESTITLTKKYEAVATDTYLTVPNGQNITLELNGHTLNRNTSAKADGCVIRNLGTLTITDNSTGHTGAIYGGNNTNGAGGIHNEGTLNFNGGTIRNNISGYSGGGIYNAGTLEISGDNTIIRDNSTTKLGAGIYNESGKSVTINSGTIQSNTNNGEHGGGIYNNGTLTINGGTISSNTVSTASKHGGGIYNAGTLSINGGTIQNNTVKDNTGLGAGIYHDGTAFNLQGAPDISSNKIVNTSTQRNVYLTAAHHIITITGTLENTTAIGINMESPSYDATSDAGVFTSGLSGKGTIAKFTSEAANTIRLTDYNKDFSHTEGELISYWSYLNRQLSDTNLPSTITLDAGSYVANNSIESYLHVPSGRTVILALNGQTLNRNINQGNGYARENGCVLFNEGDLTITGTGNIQGGHNSGTGTTQGGGIYNTGTLTLNGGTISSNKTSLRGGGIYNAGILTISGGVVQGNTSSGVGRGIYNAAGKAMTFSSGSIWNNTGGVEHGGGIYNDGTLNMTGGDISGNTITTANKNGAGVYNNGTMSVSGAASIQSNWTVGNGGAIYNAGTLTVSGGSITTNGIYVNGTTNEVRTVNGGGIYNAGTLTISGGTIQTNKATTNGGGIYNGGATFKLSGAPTISTNYVGNPQNNIYLPEAHHTITITAALSNTTPIGIRMESPDVFTSGLSGKGTIDKFVSNNSSIHKLVETGGEAALMTHWNYLQRRFNNATDNEVISLESGCSYTAGSNDTYLHVPSGKTFTLNLNGNTINRNITQNVDSKKDNGCVIYNQGTLTITGSGTIQGGNNSDATAIKGGGICNASTLTLESGAIRWNMAATSGGGIYHTGAALNIQGGTIQTNIVISGNGGGIYHNGTTFNLQGTPYLSGNTANGATNNVYLESGKKITIAAELTNTTAIGITSADDHPVFTTGLKGYDDDATRWGNADNFKADLTTHGIGLDSNGEAIVGPKYNVTRVSSTYPQTYSYVYIKGEYYKAMTAVEGETVKVKIRGESSYGTIPVNFDCDGVPFHSYPEADVEYSFVMPAHDVTVTGECQRGGYCGKADEKDIKYYLKEGTLYFMTKDANSYEMQNYAYGSVPWSNLSYTAINIPTTVTTISPYAFYGKDITTANIHQYIIFIGVKAFMGCTHLTNISVDGSNANYSSSDGVLYNKAKADLICYPAGKEDHSYTLPSTVQSIAEGAFAYGSHLQTITVAGGSYFKSVDGVLYNYAGTTLVYYPAGNNSVSYEVPTTANTVGSYAFHNAKNLTHVFLLHDEVPNGNTAMFDESTFYIMVNSTKKNTYEGTSPWSNYATRYRSIELSATNPNEQATITLEYTSIDYNGTAFTPGVTVKKDNRTLTLGTDYTVGYSNNTEVGTATVTITGAGVYAGSSISTSFTITRKVDFGAVTGQYATYFATEDLELPSSILDWDVYESTELGYTHPFKAYTITKIIWGSGTIEISEIIPGQYGYIPNGVPVILYNKVFSKHVSEPYHLTKYTGAPTSVSQWDDFKGVSTSTSYSDLIVGNADLYVLRNDKFVRATGGNLPANKLPANRCYIARPTSPSSAPAYLSISGIDDNTTGITMEDGRGKTEELFTSDWYTINGVKLNGMPTKKGIYINNGRKVIIK